MRLSLTVLFLSLWYVGFAVASDSLSYSGRLVNSNGSPVTGSVNLKADLAYTSSITTTRCSDTLMEVPLVNGVFHIKLDLDCTPETLTSVLSQTPNGADVAIRITDLSNSKIYSFQTLNAIPFSLMAKTLDKMEANTDDILQWDGSKWKPVSMSQATSGTSYVTEILTGDGLTGGPIDSTGTISIVDNGVTNNKIANGVSRSKLASGTANYVLVNAADGSMSELPQLGISQGGTGANTQTAARSNLGLGTAAVLNTGVGATNVLVGGDLPSCSLGQKLMWNLPPTVGWSCSNDADSLDSTKLPLDGSVAMSGELNMGANKIIGLGDPVNLKDGANKEYVDTKFGAVTSSQWLETGFDLYFNSGFVGIGTATPASHLHISGDAPFLTISDTNTGINSEAGLFLEADGASGGISMLPAGFINPASWADSMLVYSDNINSGGLRMHANAGNITLSNGSGVKVDRVVIDPTGKMDLTGNLVVSGTVRLKDATTNYVELKAPATVGAAVVTYTLPASYGTNGQALMTDASGNLSWGSVAVGSFVAKAGDAMSGSLALGGNKITGLGTPSAGTDAATKDYVDTASTVGGDLSGPLSSAQIVAGAVGTAEIANTSVTYAKLSLTDGDIPLLKVNGLQTALDGKEPTITNPNDTSKYWRGDKSWQSLNSDAVTEGSTNLYFLPARVLSSTITGYAGVSASALPIGDGESLLTSLKKLQLQITANDTAFDGTGQWSKNGTKIHYDSNYVGLGIADPLYRLHVNADPSYLDHVVLGNLSAFPTASPEVYVGRTEGTGAGRFAQAGHLFLQPRSDLGSDIIFATGTTPTERMTISSNGDVGIGTNAPTGKLHISGNMTNSAIHVDAKITNNGSILRGVSLNPIVNTDTNGSGGVSLAPKLELTADVTGLQYGNIFNPKLQNSANHVTGRISGNFFRADTDATYTGNIASINIVEIGSMNHVGSGTITNLYGLRISDQTGGANNFAIHQDGADDINYFNGKIGIGTSSPFEKLEVSGNIKATAFLYTSDRRLKQNIETLKNPSQKVLALRGVEFDWKESGVHELGFIAQEVEKIEPNLVVTSEIDGMKSVKYGNVVALLVEAFKEDHKKIEENKKLYSVMSQGLDIRVKKLEREVASLKEENKKLKEDIELIKKHLKMK